MRKSISLIVFLAVVTSCSKYEDNKGIQLSNKDNRLTQMWKVDKRIDQLGNEGIGAIKNYDFKENGDLFIYRKVIMLQTQDTLSWIDTCTWSWIGNKEKIRLDFINVPNGYSYDIKLLRLQKNHLWFEQLDNGGNFSSIYECTPVN